MLAKYKHSNVRALFYANTGNSFRDIGNITHIGHDIDNINNIGHIVFFNFNNIRANADR